MQVVGIKRARRRKFPFSKGFLLQDAIAWTRRDDFRVEYCSVSCWPSGNLSQSSCPQAFARSLPQVCIIALIGTGHPKASRAKVDASGIVGTEGYQEPSYTNAGGTGNRTSMIIVTTDATLGGSSGPINRLVDGNKANWGANAAWFKKPWISASRTQFTWPGSFPVTVIAIWPMTRPQAVSGITTSSNPNDPKRQTAAPTALNNSKSIPRERRSPSRRRNSYVRVVGLVRPPPQFAPPSR